MTEDVYVFASLIVVTLAVLIVARGKSRKDRQVRTKNFTPEGYYTIGSGGKAITAYKLTVLPTNWLEASRPVGAPKWAGPYRYAVVDAGEVVNIVTTDNPPTPLPHSWVETDGFSEGFVGSTYDPSTGFDDRGREF